MRFDLDGAICDIAVLARRPELALAVNSHAIRLRELPAEQGGFRLQVGGREIQGWRWVDGDAVHLRVDGRSFVLNRHDIRTEQGAGDAASGDLYAEMPGTVVALHALPGSDVEPGDKLLTIESMKLQTILTASRQGRIAALHVAENASFERGALLVSFAGEAE